MLPPADLGGRCVQSKGTEGLVEEREKERERIRGVGEKRREFFLMYVTPYLKGREVKICVSYEQ